MAKYVDEPEDQAYGIYRRVFIVDGIIKVVDKAIHINTFRLGLIRLLSESGIEHAETYNYSSLREGRIKMLIDEGATPLALFNQGYFSSYPAAVNKIGTYRD